MKVLRGCFGFVAVLGLWFLDKACHTLWWSFFRLNTVIWHRRPVRDTWHWQRCDQDTWQGCDQSAWHPWTLLSCNWPGHHSCHEAVISRVQGTVQCSVAALDCVFCSGCLQRPASPARGLVLVLVWRWCNSPHHRLACSSGEARVQCGASVPVVVPVPVQTPEPECTHRINQLLADWCPIVQCNMNVMLEWLINVFDVPYQKS